MLYKLEKSESWKESLRNENYDLQKIAEEKDKGTKKKEDLIKEKGAEQIAKQ